MLNVNNLKNRGNNLSLDLAVRNIIRRQSQAFNGVWYDPSDLSTMFQDSAGTIPVTAPGQPVGLILDKSGKGNHAAQSATGYKPLYRKSGNLAYLEFDGLDDFLVTGNIDFSGSDKVAVAAGVRKLSDAAAGMLVELGPGTLLHSFYVTAPQGVATYGCASKGSLTVVAVSPATFAAPVNNVVSVQGNIALDICNLRINGAQVESSSSDQGTGKYGNYPLYIGRRGGTTFSFKGNLYGLFIGGGLDDIYKLKKVEQYLAAKTGVII